MAEDTATATPTPPGGAQPEAQDPKQQAAGEPIDATAPKPAEAKPPEPPKTYKRKVNGREEEIPADAVDAAAKALGLSPNELLSTSQLKRAAYERFEEAQKIQKQYERLRGIKDPWELAREMAGLDDGALDKAAEDRLIAKLQREAMPPEQRALAEERERIAKERADLDKQKAESQKAQVAQHAQALRESLEPKIIAAVEQAGLPKTTDAVRAVVVELERQAKYGLPIDPAQAAADVREQFFRPSLGILKAMTPEQIVAELGKEKWEEMLRFSIQQKTGAPPPQQPKPAEAPKQAAKGYLTTKEWNALYGPGT